MLEHAILDVLNEQGPKTKSELIKAVRQLRFVGGKHPSKKKIEETIDSLRDLKAVKKEICFVARKITV